MIERPPLYIEKGAISAPLSIVRDISAFDPEYLFYGPGFCVWVFFICLTLFALLDMELKAFLEPRSLLYLSPFSMCFSLLVGTVGCIRMSMRLLSSNSARSVCSSAL